MTLFVKENHYQPTKKKLGVFLSFLGAGPDYVHRERDPTKDLADEIRALLKQRHRSDSPRQIEGTRQYIRRHLAADTEVTPPDRLKVLGSTLGDTWQ